MYHKLKSNENMPSEKSHCSIASLTKKSSPTTSISANGDRSRGSINVSIQREAVVRPRQVVGQLPWRIFLTVYFAMAWPMLDVWVVLMDLSKKMENSTTVVKMENSKITPIFQRPTGWIDALSICTKIVSSNMISS